MGGDPGWTDSLYKYAVNCLSRNVWKFGREMDLDDLLQESYFLFLRLQEKYPEVEIDSAHFMGLWKVALRNNFVINLAAKRTRRRESSLPIDIGYEPSYDSIDWGLDLDDAPEQVKTLIKNISEYQRRPRRLNKDGKRETTNERLCRIAGLPTTVPLRRLFEKWLGIES